MAFLFRPTSLTASRASSVGLAALATTMGYCQYQQKQSEAVVRCHEQRSFLGKTIIITGGGGNFGTAGAKYFIEQGANVVLVDVNKSALDKASEAVGVTRRLKTCVCDVRKPEEVVEVVMEAKEAYGTIDLLWNNAGYQGQMKPLLEYSSKDMQAVMDINVVGAFNVLQAVAREMAASNSYSSAYKGNTAASKGKGGLAVVQTGSVAGLRGTPTMGAYVASKAAIHGLTMTAAKDLAPHGIRVNTVSPALIGPETGYMWVRQNELHAASGSPYFSSDASVVAQNKIKSVPLKRLGDVEEVVQAVAFLLSDEASYITGTNLVVAGGMA